MAFGLSQPVTVNGISPRWLVDTGAARSVVTRKEADKLRLKPTGELFRLSGIGKRVAKRAHPVKLQWKERSCQVALYIVKELIVSGLLGYEEAQSLQMVIRPAEHSVSVLLMDEHLPLTNELTEQPPLPFEDSDRDKDQCKKSAIMKEKISSTLTDEQKNKLWEVLVEYRKVWLDPIFGYVKTYAQFKPIDRPHKEKMRPMSAELRQEMDKQIDELLKLKVIRPSKSPWASAPVFVRKADGSWRMAIDYRQVNKRIKTDGYPLPLLWEQLQLAGGHLYYARLDGKSGFFNVPLTEDSKELTAFHSHRGLFEYNVLPFGIKNSPAEFQRVMDAILSELYGKGVLCYIDDIIIYADVFEEWLALIRDVLRRLLEGGVYVEPKKCEYGCGMIPLLGYVLSKEGIMPNPEKVRAVKEAAAQRNKKELMSFLGLVGFIRRFIPHYSDHTTHLSNLLRKNVVFKWTDECEFEFQHLKNLVIEQILLSVPRGNGPYVIFTDASEKAIGCVLSQWRDNALHVLEFASHKFSSAEVNWSTREREAYAIRWAIEKFAAYIRGARIYVLTDHASLQWMSTAASRKVQRWALYLQQFDITVKAIRGADNGMADWLSRTGPVPDPIADAEIDFISTPVHVMLPLTEEKEAVRTYARSPYLPTMNQWLEASRDIPKGDKAYTKQSADGLWYSIHGKRLYVPEILRESILYYFHAGRYSGHFGAKRTLRRLTKWFYWPKQSIDVAKYVSACLPCKRVQPPGKRYLRQVLERSEPFQLVSLDHVGPREWVKEKVWYLVIIDHFSRFVVAKRVRNVSALETVKVFNEFWVQTFGAPEAVLVDKGSAFKSHMFQSFVCDFLAADLVYCGTGYPQGNAINESVHKGIEASIVARRQYDLRVSFEEILGDAVLAYNSVPHSFTGLSPYYMLFGKELILPALQRFREGLPERVRQARMAENRTQAMHRAVMGSDEGLRLYKALKLKAGDQVVYYLRTSEREGVEVDQGQELFKYSPKWSTPVKVIAVRDSTVEVEVQNGKSLLLPERLVRKLGANAPPSLQKLVLSKVDKELARLSVRPDWEYDSAKKRPRTDNVNEQMLHDENVV